MTEEEALIRAREARAAVIEPHSPSMAALTREGHYDDTPGVQAALRALLDLDKPLPVDRDLEDLREIAALMVGQSPDPVAQRWAANIRSGLGDEGLRVEVLPTFRAIIQRRIEEAGK